MFLYLVEPTEVSGTQLCLIYKNGESMYFSVPDSKVTIIREIWSIFFLVIL